MFLFKCKICGGDLEFAEGSSVAVCAYCGTKQTLPRLDDDRRANLYDRANHFRRNNEFDKAEAIYEQILAEDREDAEAYWSLVLCRFGIEYVEDPKSHKRIPTVNRAQLSSVYSDDNYKNALAFADDSQKELYEAEAKAIDDIQKGILEISAKEKPFDVFICYKESDANGRRTKDSVYAQDIYKNLTDEGYRVFFSRITLEDKLGEAYEPYIFAALNSAKVMIVVGTSKDNLNAVWVRNEWSRFLSMINGGAKKTLIPVYKDMDPYDLPGEFAYIQAQDMAKIGFMQDLLRGIEKIVKPDKKNQVVVDDVFERTLNTAYKNLAAGNFRFAERSINAAMGMDAADPRAIVAEIMLKNQVKVLPDLPTGAKIELAEDPNYKLAIENADPNFKKELIGYAAEQIYLKSKDAFEKANSQSVFEALAEKFKSISGFKDADALAEQCLDSAELCRIRAKKAAKKRKIITAIISSAAVIVTAFVIVLITVIIPEIKYNSALNLFEKGDVIEAIAIFEDLNGYKNSNNYSVLQIEKTDSGYSVTGYTGKDTKIVIPNGITSIGERAFYNCSFLTSIEIPSSVTSIGDWAFSGCSSLTSIEIPASVTSIGGDAFYGCSALTSIEIPASVTSIGNDAFYDCSSLTSIEIPEGVTSIESYAFYGCSSLRSIEIPESVTIIGTKAFYGCHSLTSIEIPASVTRIGAWALSYCSSLTSINYKGTKAQWEAINKGSGWKAQTGNYTVYCTDGKADS